ncbi:MAG: ABC transporter ATP-binding protein/permease [Oscillospiraceae bacterium]|nr:ABC transporter ATP-binding protein/permease [Oscillospiraceae bacterium]
MAWGITIGKKPESAKGAARRILPYLAAYRPLLALVIALCLVSNIMALFGPTLAGNAISEAEAGVGKVNFSRIYYYVRLMLVFYLGSSLLTICINVIMVRISKNIARRLRQDVFEKLMRLPVSFFDRTAAGDIISLISYDVDLIGTCLATDVVQIVTNAVTIVGALLMMLYISPALSLVVFVTIPLSVGFTVWMRKMTRPRYAKRSQNYSVMNGFVEEMLSGQKTIQAYAYADAVQSRFGSVNRAAAEAYYEADGFGVLLGVTMGFINNLSLALIAMLGAVLYMLGGVNLGQISSFVLYSRKFTGPINEIANTVNEIFSALSAAERVFHLLDETEEPEDSPDALRLEQVRGHVKLEHVSFGYDPQRLILHDLNLDAPPGRMVAIVGPTGAGKTTIINLLMRFYDVSGGQILVDDSPVDGYTRESLRGAYAMVLQDTWLFQGTVFENIAYGRENAGMEDVVRVAKAAHIHSFILRLPQGYDTVIEADGGNISKGQKQLLTIARAMLYDAKMLILDEATSNVDTETERAVQQAMRELMRGKTCFTIAHRLSTIQSADDILVVDHGDVVEQGTHAELMQKKGFYYRLYDAQFR